MEYNLWGSPTQNPEAPPFKTPGSSCPLAIFLASSRITRKKALTPGPVRDKVTTANLGNKCSIRQFKWRKD